jgi:predicted nucleic acid-binding Zn ribbon protein
MKKSNTKSMAHIGSILNKTLQSIRTEGDGDMFRIWDVWDKAVGDAVAKNSRPSGFKGRCLLVNVTSSAWIHHLGFLKKELMAKINSAVGSDMVSEITFKIGPVRR